ncbi:MAG TPA: hypothetical protein VGD56_10330 [Gemmatirosa sp.]
MRLASALLPLTFALVFVACDRSGDARQSGQVRYRGRTVEEWWQLRRDPDDMTVGEARVALRTVGPAAVPFLAEKAASHDLGDVIGGSVALEYLCPDALPAMRAARGRYPSAALDGAIRLVEGTASDTARSHRCAKVDSARAERR